MISPNCTTIHHPDYSLSVRAMRKIHKVGNSLINLAAERKSNLTNKRMERKKGKQQTKELKYEEDKFKKNTFILK